MKKSNKSNKPVTAVTAVEQLRDEDAVSQGEVLRGVARNLLLEVRRAYRHNVEHALEGAKETVANFVTKLIADYDSGKGYGVTSALSWNTIRTIDAEAVIKAMTSWLGGLDETFSSVTGGTSDMLYSDGDKLTLATVREARETLCTYIVKAQGRLTEQLVSQINTLAEVTTLHNAASAAPIKAIKDVLDALRNSLMMLQHSGYLSVGGANFQPDGCAPGAFRSGSLVIAPRESDGQWLLYADFRKRGTVKDLYRLHLGSKEEVLALAGALIASC